MGISGFFGKRNLERISVDIEFPDEVYSRTDFPLKLTLTNRRRFLPAFLIKIRIKNTGLLFPFVDAGNHGTRYTNVSFNRRGLHRIEEIYICSVFPFNFFNRCKRIDKAVEFVVFPKAKKCEYAAVLERERRSRGEKPSDKMGYEGDVISSRDYIEGDPLKYIHWKATAKTGQLKTKELSSLSQQPVIIDFDKAGIKNTEEKISCITYMILKLLKQNIPVGLRIRNKLYKPGISGKLTEGQVKAGKINMLRELALYDAE